MNLIESSTESSSPVSAPKRGHLRRGAAAVLMVLAIATGAGLIVSHDASADSYNAVIGGCQYNCNGYGPTTPASFMGISTRADLGSIGVNVSQGYAGQFAVQVWIYSYATRSYTYNAAWYNDSRSSAQVSTPGSGLMTLYPSSKGAHAVYVQITMANGTVVHSGWTRTYSNYRWVTNHYQWMNDAYAYL